MEVRGKKVELWWLVAARFMWIPVVVAGLLVAFIGGVFPAFLDPVFYWASMAVFYLAGAIGVSSLLAPYAIYKDRQQLSYDEGWYPKWWYYFIVFPTGILGFFLSILYTHRRRNVTPSGDAEGSRRGTHQNPYAKDSPGYVGPEDE